MPRRWRGRTWPRRGRIRSARAIGATTDARYYLNQFGIPALCYGPRARNIHAIGEAVELASIVTGAKALARFIAGFYASRPPRGGSSDARAPGDTAVIPA